MGQSLFSFQCELMKPLHLFLRESISDFVVHPGHVLYKKQDIEMKAEQSKSMYSSQSPWGFGGERFNDLDLYHVISHQKGKE